MSWLENRFPPPLMALAFGILMQATTLGAPPATTLLARVTLSALFFVTAGFFAIPAISSFSKAKTTINPVQLEKSTSLVTSGIYRFSRNPMYVALVLLLLSWSSWLAQPVAFAGPIIFALFVNRFQILPEERVLKTKFGADYLNYQNTVRRWL